MFFTITDIVDLTSIDGGNHKVDSIDEAYSYCKKIATRHYENFPVGSIIVPSRLRDHFFAVYAYSRLTDDIADEYAKLPQYKDDAVAKLKNLAIMADNDFDSCKGNPILWALSDTMKKLSLPAKPFQNLTVAFIQDIRFEMPDTLDDIMEYCKNSANPIGELVLRLFGEYTESKGVYSDKICTALQLANFWQDLSIDLPEKRVYIPKKILNVHHIDLNALLEREKSVKLQNAITDLYKLTYDLFIEGALLIELVENWRLRLELKLIINGGLKILSKVIRLKDDILWERPKLTKLDIVEVFIKSFFRRV